MENIEPTMESVLQAIKKHHPHDIASLSEKLDNSAFAVRPIVNLAKNKGYIKQFNGVLRVTPSGLARIK